MKTSQSKTLALAAVALLGASLAACSSASPSSAPSQSALSRPVISQADLNWGSCPPPAASSTEQIPRNPRQQCASLQVPLDYSAPIGQGSKTLSLEISRISSGKPNAPALLIGQGGPGLPGLDLPSWGVSNLPPSTVADDDLYGLDYRGIGNSSPISCRLGPDELLEANNIAYPDAKGSTAELVTQARQIAQDCLANAGTALPYINTANAARDLNQLRLALQQPKLSYFGTSYATYLGQVYASLFPDSSGSVVLNSVVSSDGTQLSIRHKDVGVQQAFTVFAHWAAKDPAKYHLGTDAATVQSHFLRAVAALNASPIPLPNGKTLYGNQLLTADQALLEKPSNFPELAKLIGAAESGKLTPQIAVKLPLYNELPDNLISAQTAFICNDGPAVSRNPLDYAKAMQQSAAKYPLTAGSADGILPCAFWPASFPGVSAQTSVPASAQGPANLLLVQHTADPATALLGAQQTLRAFGPRAAMITVDGEGHGVPVRTGCAAAAVADFYTTGKLPKSTECGETESF
ncbi:alpha/beta hydrolase [Psychromicrobium sp. YIM B11713]|uniref:alpha/beta hydrolase n=1 Tax=Psychromicrobium sp. YIM B11713 TaxID=3145233 RepID=UPI00374E7A44